MGEVRHEDVLVIVTRTRMEDKEAMLGVVHHYMGTYLRGLDHDECIRVALRLWDEGRIHQPRLFTHQQYYSFDSLWLDAVPTHLTDNETVRTAWEHYQLALKMATHE